MQEHPFKNFIIHLSPSTWQEIVAFLFACGIRMTAADTAIIFPSLPGQQPQVSLETLPKTHLRTLPADALWAQLPGLEAPVERIILPLTLLTGWDLNAAWSWLVANCRPGGEVFAVMANLSYLPLLHALIRGSFLPAAATIRGPVMDHRQWCDTFAAKGCDPITIEWLPNACFLPEQGKTMNSELLLSPGYVVKMTLPAAA